MKAPFYSFQAADLVLLMVDGTQKYNFHLHQVVQHLVKFGNSKLAKQQPFLHPIVLINKIDAVEPATKVLPLLNELKKEGQPFLSKQFLISSLTRKNFELVKEELLSLTVPRNWRFDPQVLTEQSLLRRVTEIIREKIYLHLHQEVPYNAVQKNRGWTESPDGTLYIDQTIFVNKNSLKKMVIGKKGEPQKKK